MKKKVLLMNPFDENRKTALRTKWSGEFEFMEINDNNERKEKILEANIILGEPDIDEIKDSTNLEWVQMSWAGTDKYTLNPGFPSQVLLTNASGAFGDAMAEYAIGAILSAMRHFSFYEKNMEKGIWKASTETDGTFFDKTVLILGAGNIGSKTAVRLKAFGAKTIGVRKNVSSSVNGFDRLITLEEVEQVLPDADVVIGCIPNSAATQSFFNEKRLKLMKKDSYLLNMGRGSLIVTEDLCKVLSEGWFKAVILDVTAPEPLPAEHPLWKEERVMITPHCSGPSFHKCEHTVDLIYQIIDDNLGRFSRGEELRNVIRF